ncbi:Soluble lytic murein transglycosylase [Pseudomonas sp. PA15(2017)]|nr:Soluble lytic murein transglycosylase [Pseudomonas sp. PA15(2017)]
MLASAAAETAWAQWPEVPPPAYQLAGHTAGTPSELLYAVAKTESNAKLRIGYFPWPWTLNVKGKAMYFSTREEACRAALEGIQKHGERGVDIGLTQQNWGYVGKEWFSHPCDALDPYANLSAASKQLRRYFDTTGDWLDAAGKYHRPAGGTPARRYRAQVRSRLGQICAQSCSFPISQH